MDDSELEVLLAEKRRTRDLPFDIQPVVSATLDDLDLDLFCRIYLPSALAADILEQNQRTVAQQLASTRFATVKSHPNATTLGIWVVGKDPRLFFPGAYVQFLRIDGTKLTDPIQDQNAIGGQLLDLLTSMDKIFQAHISITTDITTQSLEIRHPDYPIVAMQQLARNAILHRMYEGTYAPVRVTWFSDRVEIQNPGGPFGQVNRQNFGTPGVTDYRNPHLAEAMRNLGYIQRFGMGIPLAYQELEKNGNPPPEFLVEETHVLVILRRRL